MQTLPCPRGGVSGLTFSPDGDMLAGIGGDALYCWTRSRGWEQSGLRGQLTAQIFHPDGRRLAVGEGENQTVAFREPLTGGLVAEYDFGVGPVQSLAYAPDGLAVAGHKGLVVVDVG